jgi:hypothetical protein
MRTPVLKSSQTESRADWRIFVSPGRSQAPRNFQPVSGNQHLVRKDVSDRTIGFYGTIVQNNDSITEFDNELKVVCRNHLSSGKLSKNLDQPATSTWIKIRERLVKYQ